MALDISALTDAAGDFGTAIAAAGALYVTAVVATQTFPFIASWVKKIRTGASGR